MSTFVRHFRGSFGVGKSVSCTIKIFIFFFFFQKEKGNDDENSFKRL